MPPSRAVGIDLGATRAALARVDEHGRSVMIRDAEGDQLIPSVVFFEDDEVVCARSAKLAAAARPERVGEAFKRDLGEAAYCKAIGGELLPAEFIEACLIKKLVAELAAQEIAKPAAVLSTPACFNQAQRRARLDAARIAGLEVLGTLNDPLAAAICFAESQGYLGTGQAERPGKRVLVFDLGSGKLDVAIVEIKPGHVRTMAVGGDARLGGRDFDVLLADHLADEFGKQCGGDPRHDMQSVRRLLETAAEVKQSLSARQQTRTRVERDNSAAEIVITRQTFEQLSAELLDAAAAITEQVLNRAGMAWRDLSGLLLVGAATRMPMIAARLEALTGHKPLPTLNADEAVARGAAVYAESLLAEREERNSELSVKVSDVTAHSLGLEWHDPQTTRVENVVLIARGTELPCGTSAAALTDAEGQTSLVVQLLEGESRVADECARIAELRVRDLPADLPAGTSVDVQYKFTAEGRLQVRAQLPQSGQALSISVRRQHGLSAEELADWQYVLARGQGLGAIREVLLRHQQRGAKRAEAPAAPAVPPPLRAGASGAEALQQEEFSLETSGDPTATRLRKRKQSPRRVLIMLAGYVVSALVGSAIGYYILMRIDPSYNIWHLKLPGLRDAPASTVRVRQDLPSPRNR